MNSNDLAKSEVIYAMLKTILICDAEIRYQLKKLIMVSWNKFEILEAKSVNSSYKVIATFDDLGEALSGFLSLISYNTVEDGEVF